MRLLRYLVILTLSVSASKAMDASNNIQATLTLQDNTAESKLAVKGDENPYSTIVARNMFDLLPIVDDSTNQTLTPVKPPPTLKIVGFATVFRSPQIFVSSSETNKQYALELGETKDNITFVSIDTNALITVINHGETQRMHVLAKAEIIEPNLSTNSAPDPLHPPFFHMPNNMYPTGVRASQFDRIRLPQITPNP